MCCFVRSYSSSRCPRRRGVRRACLLYIMDAIIVKRARRRSLSMQHFPCDDLKFEYSAQHEPIGWVSDGETFQVSTADCFSGRFRHPDDYTPENVAWVNDHLNGLTGPI